MYGVHSCIPDLHASYEGTFVKIYGKKTISLVTSGTQEVLSTMQGCTLQSVLFLWRREKNQKRHPPPTKSPPIWGDLTAPPVALTLRYAQTIKGLA